MNRYYYDFHIHSCLSPCADNDMTPANIAGMATLAGLNIVALTDHNTAKNCPAFFKAAKLNGIIPIAGMELTTAEDIHIVCLFEHLEDALAFSEAVDKRRIRIKNRTDIFGDQLIMDAEDNVIGTEDDLLSNATDITYDEVPSLVEGYNGVCFPAHVDRQANGVIATLGTLPETPFFAIAEFHDADKQEEYKGKYPELESKLLTVGSDAHYLWDIRDKSAYFELDDEPYSSSKVRHSLFEVLRCGK
jgi:hypothetical protein